MQGINRRVRGHHSLAALAVLFTACGILGAGVSTSMVTADPGTPRGAVKASNPTPRLIMPSDSDGIRVYRAALSAKGTKIMVSTESRWLWMINGRDTLVSAPVAIGMGNTFEFNGKKWKFDTPRGKRVIRGKTDKPMWTVPEWHYFEKAAARGLQAVHLKEGQPHLLDDGTWIDIREHEGQPQVGRVNKFGNWWPFSQDFEIIFEGKIFIPPINTLQRKVTDALGPYKLDMGEGYLIHGTHIDNEDSIGQAASHGCVRMRNADLTILYQLVSPGTPVYIF